MAVVPPEERSAAAGVTNVVRSNRGGHAAGDRGRFHAAGDADRGGLPFIFAGGLKILYDILLYRRFIAVKPPEERKS